MDSIDSCVPCYNCNSMGRYELIPDNYNEALNNKCCDDRREHNIAESLEQKFPLLCKGKFSMNEEKFFDMLLSNIPREYQEIYFFDMFGDQIEQQAIDNGVNECEARMDLD